MTNASRHLIRIAPLDAVSQHHAHDHFQIVIGLSGRAAFVIDGQGGEIGPFQGCLVPAGREHVSSDLFRLPCHTGFYGGGAGAFAPNIALSYRAGPIAWSAGRGP